MYQLKPDLVDEVPAMKCGTYINQGNFTVWKQGVFALMVKKRKIKQYIAHLHMVAAIQS